MNRIASFSVDHDYINKDIYISRIDGDVTTYDMRTRIPNAGDYMDNVTMHSLEHMFATYVRNSEIGGQVIYFGPMGCRTGFYLLVRDTLAHRQAIELVRQSMAFVRDFTGEIPGNTRIECGNYLDHDLDGAKKVATDMCKVLETWSEIDLQYK